MNYLKPMLPTLATEIPKGDEWIYEVKYDGFRATIYIDETETKIISRNLNDLSNQFPEIVVYINETVNRGNLAPTILDGELCVLETDIKADFDSIQKRGRLKNAEKIEQAKNTLPVSFLAFDILMKNGISLKEKPLIERKEQLTQFFQRLPKKNDVYLKIVKTYDNALLLWDLIKKQQGEGIVAKQKTSTWLHGKRTTQWVKIKNLLIATFFVLGYDEKNSFFHIGCLYNDDIKMIGKVGQGFSKEEKEALTAIIMKNSIKKVQHITYVNPSICIEVEFLEMSKNELRHPKFRRFRFDKHWEDCRWEKIQQMEQR